MAYKRVCGLDDVWEGEMQSFEVDGHEVLVVCVEGGEIRAYQGTCPHQEIALVEGKFDGRTLICRAHSWVFDGKTGVGINPGGCKLAAYPVKIEGEDVYVETEGVSPYFAPTPNPCEATK